ncbi:MAG: hypothetical protein C1943_04765 [Halochromatium sp.]|nr:hypothetical protein [Halochromatium sp.]
MPPITMADLARASAAEIAMPETSASKLSSHQRLAWRRDAFRRMALSAAGLLICATSLMADDAATGNATTSGAATQASADNVEPQANGTRISSERPTPGQVAEAQTEAELDQVQEAPENDQSPVASLRSKLDAVEAEKARLSLQLDLLNRKQVDLEAQARELDQVRRQLYHSQTAAERAEIQAEALRTEIEQLKQQRELAAQKHTAQLTASELRLREHKDRLGGVDARLQQLEQQLAQREAQIARLEAGDARRAEAKDALEARIAELRSLLPAPEGGTVTVAVAEARARQDAENLERLIREGQGIRNPQLWRQIRDTENALHRSQYLLARAQGNHTLYRVRPGDSLARISAMVYGNDQSWTQIFEANRHLLDDPDRVPPGFTLVIPE